LQDREVSGNWLEELSLNFVNRFCRLARVGHGSPVGRSLPAAFLENARFGDSWHCHLDAKSQAQPRWLRLGSCDLRRRFRLLLLELGVRL
jgi:hypothetical protein